MCVLTNPIRRDTLPHSFFNLLIVNININRSFMKKVLFYLIFLSGLIFFSPLGALADVSCQPIYGGGQNCITVGRVIINKTVQNPQTNQFVDNLNVNDPKFSPNQTVTFQISLTNTGSTIVPQIVVKDIFPNFVNFVSGPGNFDNNTKTLTFITYNLNPNETRNFTLQGKVVDNNQLPSDMVTCVVNQSTLTATDSSQAQDNSQFCIQKQQTTTKGGLPIVPPTTVTTTPATGPELLPLIGMIPTGIAGFLLRRKTQFKGGER